MNDDHNHEPTPEFRASLEREMLRAYRSEVYFAEPERRRRVRVGTIAGIAAGAVVTLTIGLVLGASTGYASAGEIIKARGDTPLPPTMGLAVLKNIPPLMFSCGDLPIRAAKIPVTPAEQGPAVVDLPPASMKSAMTFGGILGVRESASGTLLVDDAGRHQVTLLDRDLTLKAIVRDSAPGSATSYGPRPVPLIRYLGDSSILADDQGGSLLVLGPTGSVVRAMAPSHPDMMLGLNLYFGSVDDRGRIIFESHVRAFERGMPGGVGQAYAVPESTVLVRADLDSRGADTLARLKTRPGTMMINNGGVTKFSMDPLPLVDTWAMASDGSIAVIRGHDYHIDWIHADGTMHSTPKLPFDWKRMTDEEKQRLIDSVRDNESPRMARTLGQRRVGPRTDDGGRGGRGYSPAGTIEQGPPVPVEYVPPKLSEMFDFYPPIRPKAALPDLDGNVWILPTSSAQSKNGELVYDVVNVKGDFHRVRFPLGRSLVGFGKGGVVYMISGDKTNGFVLEKTRRGGKPPE